MPRPKPSSPRSAARAAHTRAADRTPEQSVRSQLHRRGLRFGRRARDLPGRPELVLPKRRTVVFVHGCFWHGHGCAVARAAARFNTGAWAEKIAANQAQFEQDRAALQAAGWQVERIWECETERPLVLERLAARLRRR